LLSICSLIFYIIYLCLLTSSQKKKSKTKSKSNPTDLFFSCRVVAAIGLLMIVVAAAAAVACRFQSIYEVGELMERKKEEIQNNKNICVCV
jgi:hypothetical protein